MLNILRSATVVVAAACLAFLVAPVAEAKTCFKKGAIGEAGDTAGAKFQVDEALLQAVDWGAWASWMASGTTPGYSFGPRSYSCTKGGSWGVTCHGQATICKL
jgi:hypothetical protein